MCYVNRALATTGCQCDNWVAHLWNAKGEAAAPTIAELIQELQSGNLAAQLGAADELARDGSQAKAAVPALATGLENWKLRRRVAHALVRIGLPAVPALLQALKTEEYGVGQAAQEALTRIGLPAVPQLIEALSSRHKDVRNGAVEVLRELGPEA